MWEYADRADLAVKTPYDPEADIEWLSGCGNRIQMKPGMFYLVYPDDGHKPCCHEKEQTSYRKVVVKIKIDKLLHGVPAMERTAVFTPTLEGLAVTVKEVLSPANTKADEG